MQLSASQIFGLVPARHCRCSHPYLHSCGALVKNRHLLKDFLLLASPSPSPSLLHPHVELPSKIWKTQCKSSTSSANVAELSVTVIFLSLSAIPLVPALLTSNHCLPSQFLPKALDCPGGVGTLLVARWNLSLSLVFPTKIPLSQLHPQRCFSHLEQDPFTT